MPMPGIKARLCAPVALIAAVAAEAAVRTATPDTTTAPGGSFLAHRTEIAPEAVRRVTLTAGPEQSGLLVQYAEMAGDDICGEGMEKLKHASPDSTLEVTFKAQAGPASFPGLAGQYPAETDYVVTVTGRPSYQPAEAGHRRIGWKNAQLVQRARSSGGAAATGAPSKTSKIFFKIQAVPTVHSEDSQFGAQAATLTFGQYPGFAAIEHALGANADEGDARRTRARAEEAAHTRDDFLRLVYAPPLGPTPTSLGPPGHHRKHTCEVVFSPMIGANLETQDLKKWRPKHEKETDLVQSMYKMFVKHFRVMHRNGLYYTDPHGGNLQVVKTVKKPSAEPSSFLRGGKATTSSMLESRTPTYKPAVVDVKLLTYIPKDLPEKMASGKYSLTEPAAAAVKGGAAEAEKQLESDAAKTGINIFAFKQKTSLALETFDAAPQWLDAVRFPRSGKWFEEHKKETVRREWLFGAMEEAAFKREFQHLFDRKTKERLEQEVLEEEIQKGVFQGADEKELERSLIEWKNREPSSCCGGGGDDPDDQPGL